MGLAIVIVVAALLCAAVIRRAAPISIGAATAWTAWSATHDLFATCAAAFLALTLSAEILDAAASAPSRAVRVAAMGVEVAAACATGAWIVLALFPETRSGFAPAVAALCASLVGAGCVLQMRAHRYRQWRDGA